MSRPKNEPVGPGNWIEWAQCRIKGVDMAEPSDPKLWRAQVARQKAICDTCAVDAECEAWALGHPDPAEGMVAAGMTTSERKEARKKR